MTATDIGIPRRGNGGAAPSRAFERLGRYMRQPQIALPRPGKAPARITVDRVRARPAVTPTVAGTLGLMGLGLGLVGLFAPRLMARACGLSERTVPLVRACGLREIVAGFGLVADPTQTRWLWLRTAGDALDFATLKAADHPDNPYAHRARAAMGLVAVIGLVDAVVAGRMQTVTRSCGREVRR